MWNVWWQALPCSPCPRVPVHRSMRGSEWISSDGCLMKREVLTRVFPIQDLKCLPALSSSTISAGSRVDMVKAIIRLPLRWAPRFLPDGSLLSLHLALLCSLPGPPTHTSSALNFSNGFAPSEQSIFWSSFWFSQHRPPVLLGAREHSRAGPLPLLKDWYCFPFSLQNT